jgi:benzoylformate decarboxylase
VLSDEGVSKMFGNPGTTELPIMHALSSAPRWATCSGCRRRS